MHFDCFLNISWVLSSPSLVLCEFLVIFERILLFSIFLPSWLISARNLSKIQVASLLLWMRLLVSLSPLADILNQLTHKKSYSYFPKSWPSLWGGRLYERFMFSLPGGCVSLLFAWLSCSWWRRDSWGSKSGRMLFWGGICEWYEASCKSVLRRVAEAWIGRA